MKYRVNWPNVFVWGGMTIVGVGLIVLVCALMLGCSATSRITPASSEATRTTESRGPRRELLVKGYPKGEAKP